MYPWLNGVCVCREEAQSLVQGYPGAKFKKFKTKPEAEQWYKDNLPLRPLNPQATIPTPNTSTVSSPKVTFADSGSAGVTRVPSKPPPITLSKPAPQLTSRAVTIATPVVAQTLRIAAPKNTTVDIVYSDGACKSNGRSGAVAGIGVWWGPNDPRYAISFVLVHSSIRADQIPQGTCLRDALVVRRTTEQN